MQSCAVWKTQGRGTVQLECRVEAAILPEVDVAGLPSPPTPYPPSAQDLCVKDRVKVIAASGVSTQVPALLALKEDLGLGVQS